MKKATIPSTLPFKQLCWEDIDENYISRLIELARMEDLQGTGLAVCPKTSGDVTTASLEKKQAKVFSKAVITAREPLIVCGLPLIPLILKAYGSDSTFESIAREKDHLDQGSTLGIISGSADVLLQAERLVLNFLQHLSGVATYTARYVTILKDTSIRLLDTRKTTPGLRVLEKYAVACGGGWNHRMGLFDHILFKDNHLALKTSIENIKPYFETIIKNAKKHYPALAVEVEVDHWEQIQPALEAGADIILLDNFSYDELKKSAAYISGRVLIEASGNIFLEKLKGITNLDLDFISSGAITYKSCWVDIGLDWQE